MSPNAQTKEISMGYAYTYPHDHSRIIEKLPEHLWETARRLLSDQDGADIADLIDNLAAPDADKQALHDAFGGAR